MSIYTAVTVKLVTICLVFFLPHVPLCRITS